MDFGRRYLGAISQLKTENRDFLESPYMIEIEPEASCSLSCVDCSYGLIRKSQISDLKRRRLPFNLIENLINDVANKNTQGILISGGGDPLNYPQIGELIKICGEKIGPVFIQTNGLRLNKIYESPELLSNIAAISVSIYGTDPETFLSTTKKGEKTLKLLKERVETMIKINKSAKSNIIINAKILITKNNYKSSCEMIKYCEECGFDSVLLRAVQNIETGIITSKEKSLSDLEKNELTVILKSMSDRVFVKNFINNVISKNATIKISSVCHTATMGMLAAIDTDGDVYLGTPEIGDKIYSIGNIHEKKFNEIWGSNTHKSMMVKMSTDETNRACRIENCRHISANLSIDNYIKDNNTTETINNVVKQDPLGRFI